MQSHYLRLGPQRTLGPTRCCCTVGLHWCRHLDQTRIHGVEQATQMVRVRVVEVTCALCIDVSSGQQSS